MKFSDEGIIISSKKYGENSLIIKVFSCNHGVYRGFVKNVKSAKTKTIFQIGNLISFEFRSRTEDNLGSFFSVDLVRSFCSQIIFDKLKLDCASSLFSIIDNLFLEREEQENLFNELKNFLQKIVKNEIGKEEVLSNYVKIELHILQNLGYGIDLSCCAVTNSNIDLAFVSPKSGRAVSFQIGKPYENKLLKLPEFLLDEDRISNENQLLDGLKLSGFFLEKFILENHYQENKKYLLHRGEIIRSLSK